MNIRTKSSAVFLIGTLCFAVGCATSKRANLNSTNPTKAAQEVKTMMNMAETNQTDLLAKKEYMNAVDDYNEALEELSENEDPKEVLEELSESKAYLLDAKTAASGRSEVPKRILKARKNLIESGIRNSDKLVEALSEVDNDLIDETNNFNKSLSSEQFSKFQKRYLNLEVKSIQNSYVGQFEDIISKAEKNNARSLATKTLKKAKTDVNVARNDIEQNPRTQKYFKESVLEANKSTKLLDDVMNKLLGEAQGSSENVALKLVYQERKLGKLSETITNLEGQNSSQRSNLLSAEAQVRFQNAMNSVRKNFDEEDATVYQQGDKLILRLRSLNFATGSATIPSKSMPLLGKIGNIIDKLNPQMVEVQGHTDSRGGTKINETLSEKRAKSVKSYFESKEGRMSYKLAAKGFGESKPIENNETEEGRALNRRVDIVINAK